MPTSSAIRKIDNTIRVLNLESLVFIKTPFCSLAIDSEIENPKGLNVERDVRDQSSGLVPHNSVILLITNTHGYNSSIGMVGQSMSNHSNFISKPPISTRLPASGYQP